VRGGKRQGAGRKTRTDAPTEASRVTVRYSPEERTTVEAQARKAGVPLAEWIRRRTLGE